MKEWIVPNSKCEWESAKPGFGIYVEIARELGIRNQSSKLKKFGQCFPELQIMSESENKYGI